MVETMLPSPTLARLAVIAALTASSGVAAARDSTWLLCKGTATHGAGKNAEKATVVTSLLEHRAADGESRDLEVTFVWGGRASHGTIAGKNGSDAAVKGSTLKLTSVTGTAGAVVLTGTAELATDFKRFSFSGTADWAFGDDPKPTMVPVSAKLVCEELTP